MEVRTHLNFSILTFLHNFLIIKGIDTDTVNASLAYACLTSVPFNSAVALGFLDYYHDTLKFQSTLV